MTHKLIMYQPKGRRTKSIKDGEARTTDDYWKWKLNYQGRTLMRSDYPYDSPSAAKRAFYETIKSLVKGMTWEVPYVIRDSYSLGLQLSAKFAISEEIGEHKSAKRKASPEEAK